MAWKTLMAKAEVKSDYDAKEIEKILDRLLIFQ